MIEKKIIHQNSKLSYNDYKNIIDIFEHEGNVIDDRGRNIIKSFNVNGEFINVKSFKKPHLINQIAYKYFRKSKSERSYEYANILLDQNILTPQPLAYFNYYSVLGLHESYYFSQHIDYDLTFRELREIPRPNDYENILRQFTRFTFKLHEAGIFFKDHSAGNTLIIKNKTDYSFYLIDLNRMNFFTLDLNDRMRNFAKLTEDLSMVEIMSDEYSKLINQPYDLIYHKMVDEINIFRKKYNRRAKAKEKFLG